MGKVVGKLDYLNTLIAATEKYDASPSTTSTLFFIIPSHLQQVKSLPINQLPINTMVSITTIQSSNATALPASLPNGLVAVFIGATSGIGHSTLKQLVNAAKGKSPRFYIVGRSATASAAFVQELRNNDASATFEFIERDASLLRDIDHATKFIKEREEKVDLLFTSTGFISFEGRIETTEGLDPSMTTRFYSRALAIQQLLPLLNKSQNPHVTNVGAGGQEDALLMDDLDLAKPGNYSIARAAVHSATMFTIVLEKFAQENPKISFVHSFPGLTATRIMYRGSSGIVGFLLKRIIAPLINTFVSSSVEEVGARSLFYATNARYTVDATAPLSTPIPDGLDKAVQSKGGVFLVDPKSESADSEKVLGPLRGHDASRVSEHLREIFSRVL
ncbi:hypothetical protein S7711_03617 [Stachybotrys chartarum IBT 7711]|uniref:Ketoreductase (KR) domain-containing protein n=1 Tax=Stachybotrys chartarum (strain CBS 109288 / IBT 7711) TaxID=1280523 RepID=A0A084AGX2_STACB|nr:hypothetical protein S7711_03617 [Stachybotrys chartarum IBT 7711]KFA50079.1 hypothetical protein S40293_08600 [Stachybotrys chartarum IBT 40293]